MHIIILSPNWKIYFSPVQLKKLKTLGKVTCIDKIQPIHSLSQIATPEEKIVAIDPDFCNWNVTKKDISAMVNVKAR